MKQYEKAYEECLKRALEAAKRSCGRKRRRRTPTRKSRSRKRAPSAYNKFVAKHRKEGLSMKSVGRLWQRQKGKKSPKKKKTPKRKRTVKKRSKSPKRKTKK
jgi:hypothetical protein